MFKALAAFTLLCASLPSQVMALAVDHRDTPFGLGSGSPNLVVEWNKTLLVILRTPGTQPVNLHPMRSYPLRHAAIYDAVNAIDAGHAPYKVAPPSVSTQASEEAAAATAGHDILLGLYPAFQPRATSSA